MNIETAPQGIILVLVILSIKIWIPTDVKLHSSPSIHVLLGC